MLTHDKCYLLCGGQFLPSFKKNNYQILKCDSCGLYVLETDSSYDAFLKEYYSEGYFKGKEGKFGYADYLSEERMVKKNMHGYLDSLKSVKPNGLLLDVGCASGFLLEEAQLLGYSISGIDTSEYIVDMAKPEIRNHIICSPLHNANLKDESFDVITMFDLIEHLADPKKDLEKINKWLKNDGVLMIGTGDVGSFYAKMLGKHNHYFAPPHHLFFFSRKSIRELLSQVGMEVISIKPKGKWLTVPYIARVAKHFDIEWMDKFLNSNFFQNLFGNMWIYLFFGDNMVILAKKKARSTI